MIPEITAAIAARGIARLCHFTPSRNLLHIAAGQKGVLSTAKLSEAERAVFNATDLLRLDGHKEHICCSVEFPNGWYFSQARDKEPLFRDWVVLLIDPQHLAREGTLFSPGNAATGGGRYLAEGVDGFSDMFADVVQGRTTTYRRTPGKLDACPTDQQAEVLIRDQIPPGDILAVAVQNEQQGQTEQARLRITGLDPDQFRFVVAPYMFDKYALNQVIQRGVRPPELPVPTVANLGD